MRYLLVGTEEELESLTELGDDYCIEYSVKRKGVPEPYFPVTYQPGYGMVEMGTPSTSMSITPTTLYYKRVLT